jgi:putative transposase
VALDFFAVPTATFQVLFVLVVLSHGRRRLVHFNVTEHPTAEWAARQLLEACGQEEAAPRYLIRDRDQVYGERFSRQAQTSDIREAVIAPRSPWQNAVTGDDAPLTVLPSRRLRCNRKLPSVARPRSGRRPMLAQR